MKAERPHRKRPRAADVETWVRSGCAPLVASVAAYASCVHQRACALQGGADATSATLWLSVDGLLLLATVGLLKRTRHVSGRARWSAWMAFFLGHGETERNCAPRDPSPRNAGRPGLTHAHSVPRPVRSGPVTARSRPGSATPETEAGAGRRSVTGRRSTRTPHRAPLNLVDYDRTRSDSAMGELLAGRVAGRDGPGRGTDQPRSRLLSVRAPYSRCTTTLRAPVSVPWAKTS
ncbi:DUF2637 domain-containing protein [Streptomyces sp. NPDC050564]|uniref:DUF2637 domain-containing protein n=1 Tax=Streptomyces sp. NPDC050564 TaxID=3365631 RepID=UPI0037B6A6BD